MKTEQLLQLIETILDDMQAIDIVSLDVRNLTAVTDIMVFCSGRSSRHVKSIADSIVSKVKEAGLRPLGIKGEQEAEWILVDLGDVVVHIMQPETRALYDVEKLWTQMELAEAST